MNIFRTKLIKSFLVLIIVGFIIGVVLYFISSSADKINLSESLNNYFNAIKNESFNYKEGLFDTVVYNFQYITIIWVCGIIFILVFLIPIILLIKSIYLGFTIINVLSVFKLKGILYTIILSLPSIINLIIFLIMSYYSIKFANKIYHAIKNNLSINIKGFIKNYIIIFLILSFILLISSFLETYVISNILRFVI